MITAHNVTESRLLLGLHRHPRHPMHVEDLYPAPYTVTAHVHRALRQWEDAGMVISHPSPRGDAYVLTPTAIDPTWHRAALVVRAEELITARAELTGYEATLTARARALQEEIAHSDLGDGTLVTHRMRARDYAEVIERLLHTRGLLARSARDEATLRAEATQAGFDADAVWAGQPEGIGIADPLGAFA